MPPFRKDDPMWLVRYILFAAAEGTVAGWILMEILIHLDVGKIGTLVYNSPDGGVAFLIMALSFAVTFGIVGIAIRVMFDLPDHIDRNGR